MSLMCAHALAQCVHVCVHMGVRECTCNVFAECVLCMCHLWMPFYHVVRSLKLCQDSPGWLVCDNAPVSISSPTNHTLGKWEALDLY